MFYFWFWFLANLTIVTAGGHRRPIELCPTKLSMVSLGYHGRSPWRTCFIISIFLQWDVANPRTTVPICISNCVKPNQTFSFPFHVISVPVRFSQSVHREHVAHFSGRIIDPLLSGFTEVCFAHKMHSTTKFDKTVLSKCVTHNAFRHDVVSPSGNALLSRTWTP